MDDEEPGHSNPIPEDERRDEKEERMKDQNRHLEHSSLFIIPKQFPPRVWINQVQKSLAYRILITVVIILNSILLATWDPLDPDAEETRNQTIGYIDFAFLLFYTAELIITVFVRGMIMHENSYLRNGWDILDCFVVVAGWATLFIPASSGGFSALRSLRAIRPLRLIAGIPQLRKILDTIYLSGPFFVGVLLLTAVFFIIFGVMGLTFFSGELRYHCVLDDDFDENQCCDTTPNFLGGRECDEGKCKLTDDNPDFGYYNFDNILYSFLAIFLVINVEGSTRWAYITMDATSDVAAIYYVVTLFAGALFWLNFLLAIISVTMTQLPEPERGNPGWFTKKLMAAHQKMKMKLVRSEDGQNIVYRGLNAITSSEIFNVIVMLFILLNVAILAMPYRNQPDSYTLALFIIDLICLIFFTFEMSMRLVGEGVWKYFSSKLSLLDVLVVATGWLELFILIVLGSDSSSISAIRVLRALRLFRTLKLARKWKALDELLHSLASIVPSMFYMIILYGIVMFTFMLIGIRLYGGQLEFDGEIPRYNYNTLYWSFITLFVVTTGEQWPDILFDGMRTHFWSSIFFYVLWKVISTYLLLNIFLSLLIDSFEQNRKDRNAKAKNKRKEAREKELNDLAGVDKEPELEDENSEVEEERGFLNVDYQPILFKIFANPFDIKERVPHGKFLKCFPSHSLPRRQIIYIVNGRPFRYFMIFITLLACIFLTTLDPGFSVYSTRGWASFSISVFFISIFIFEMLLRMMAFGLLVPRGYFRNGWDCLDFLIILVSILSVAFSFIPSRITYSFYGFRALWILRLLSRTPGARVVMATIVETTKIVPRIMVVTLFFWIIFSIAGLQLFVGEYYYCGDADGEWVEDVVDREECLALGLTWDHWDSYFENFPIAFLTIIRSANVNFPDPMIHGVDVAGQNENPIRDNHPEFALFWVIFIVICSWFVFGLFLGSIVDSFNAVREKRKVGSLFLTDNQREWILLQRVFGTLTPPVPFKAGGSHPFRLFVFHIVTSKPFDICILLFILYGAAIQCTFHFQQAWTWDLLQVVTNIVVTVIFTLEVVMKIIGFGFRGYLANNWNRFDFVIVVISWIDIILLPFASFDALSFIKVMRIFRLLRFVRVIRFSEKLQLLIKSVLLSVATLMNILWVLIIFLYLYVVIGMYLFYDLPLGESTDVCSGPHLLLHVKSNRDPGYVEPYC